MSTSNNELSADQKASLIKRSTIAIWRSGYLGSAALLILVVLLISQIGAKDIYLQIALVASAIGMPMLVGAGIFLEVYLNYGRLSYRHFYKKPIQYSFVAMILVGALCLVTAVGALFWRLSTIAAICFGSTFLVSLIVTATMTGSAEIFYKKKLLQRAASRSCAESKK